MDFCCYFWYLISIPLVLVIIIWRCSAPPAKTKIPLKTMVVLGSGGHTKEILSLSETLSPLIYSPRVYVHSSSDHLSSRKAMTLEEKRGSSDYVLTSIFRSREVGQSWLTSVFTTILSTAHAVYIIFTIRPHLILCNGPGVCVPLCMLAFLLRKLCLIRIKIIYVESICRVKSLSLSGLILRHFVDKFFVQWESQARAYPGTKFIGRLS